MQTFAAYVRQKVKKLDKEMPVSNLRAQMDYLEMARAQTRFVTVLAEALAALALFLACIGIYGITSYSVAQRTSEIAVRLTLGAHSTDIRGLVLRHGVVPVALGVVAGLLLAAAVAPLLSGLLFGVRPSDPLTYAAISLVLAAVGALVCYIPARRAMRVDPMVALKYE